MEGQGRYLFGNGSEYRGTFENDLMQGLGTCKYTNGMLYRGEFKADRRHGKGILWFPPSSTFSISSPPVVPTASTGAKGNGIILPSLKASPTTTTTTAVEISSKKSSRTRLPPVANMTQVKSVLVERDLNLTWEVAIGIEGGSCYEGDFEDGFMHGQGKYHYAR